MTRSGILAWILWLLSVGSALAQTPPPETSAVPVSSASPSAEVDTPNPSATPPARPLPVVENIVPPSTTFRALKRLTITSLPLFQIAGNERISADDRVELVRRRVQRLLEVYGADPPAVTVSRYLGATVVRAGDHVLVTVTNADVPEFDLDQQPLESRHRMEEEVAYAWASALQQEINYAATMRTPAYLKLAWSLLLTLLVAALAGHKLLNWIGRRHAQSPLWSAKFLLWAAAIYFGLRLFPYSKAWAEVVYSGVLYPYLLILMVFIATMLVSHFAEQMVSRYFMALQQSQETVHLSRLTLRLATLDQAARVTVRAALVVIGTIVYLVLLKIDLGAVVAGAGVMGVAIGLATQDLIKNVIAGINILLEDHFGIGDVIEFNGINGTVEAFNLRCTQVRTIDGRLVTIPNNSLTMVENHSNGWGRVDFRIDVAYSVDLERALDVLGEVANGLADEWEDQITEPPAILGVENLKDNGVQLRLLLRTIPLSQWSVKRELNRRVKDRFDREGIEIPFPQRVVWSKTAPQPQETDT